MPNVLRRNHAHVAVALILALLLPLLVALLPLPALSATAQLDRDIAASLCDPDGEGPASAPRPGHDDHTQCCILCPVSGQPAAISHGSPIELGRQDDAVPVQVQPEQRPAFARPENILIEARGPPKA